MPVKTLTAPLALIKVNGRVVGRMRNIEVRETFRRVPVYGIGEGSPLELPFTQWNGTLSCGFYETIFKDTGISNAVRRDSISKKELMDQLTLDDKGVDVVLLRREKDSVDSSTQLIQGKWSEHLTIRGCFIEGDGMNLSEGSLGGHDQSFSYLNPVLASQ